MNILFMGILGGILSGLLGIGSGSIFVPALVLLAALPQPLAQGISLSVMIPTSFLGGYIYYKRGIFAKDIYYLLLIGAILGAFCGSLIANSIDQQLLKKLFSFILLFLGLKMWQS
jgi:uncharacterized membrane protein YfcA